MFPIHYIRDIFSPSNIFHHRYKMTWWKSVFVMVIWTILMTLPFYSTFKSIEDKSVNQDFDQLTNMLPDDTASRLATLNYDNGVFASDLTDQIIEGNAMKVVMIPSADNIEGYLKDNESILLILPDQFVYQVDSDTRYTANLPLDLMDHLGDNGQLVESLRQNYHVEINTQNLQMLIMTRQLTFFILGLGGLLLVASRLNILQKHHFHDLFSFEYCVGMVAMAMGVPAIVAIIVGIAFPTTAVILPILWIGTIAMLYWSYRQTGFKRNTMI